MGNSLPLISKEIIKHDVSSFRSAACSMQGYRGEMEDALICLTPFSNFPGKWLIGVFDGHCGAGMSKLLSRDLYGRLNAAEELSEEVISKICVDLDKHYMEAQRNPANGPLESQPGSTCVFAIVEQKGDVYEILGCNIGDSRILLVRPDGSVDPLTDDHKPDNDIEKNRIYNAGGRVEMSRVDGSLALSRAFGDAVYKNNPSFSHEEQKVIPVPDFMRGTAKVGDILLVACDGVFETLENHQVAQFVADRKKEGATPYELSIDVVNYAVISGSTDNISCQIVEFSTETLPAAKTEELYLPGLYFNKAPQAFKESFLKEINHLGLNAVAIKDAALKTDITRIKNAELESHFADQKTITPISLSHTTSHEGVVYHPRDAAENFTALTLSDLVDGEEQESEPDTDDMMMQLRNLLRSSDGVDPQDIFRQLLMMPGAFPGNEFDNEDEDEDEDGEEEEEEEEEGQN